MAVPLHWHTEPFLLLTLLGAGWIYAVGTGPWRNRLAPPGTPYPTGQAVAFYSALVLNYLAVGSPLDQIGEDYLFTAHMVQHMMIIYLTPPLLLLGLPWWLVDAVLARRWVKRLFAPFVHPAVCCLSFLVVFTLWHMPELYETALRHRPIHVIEHVTIYLAAMQMWWIFVSPSRVFPPCSYPIRLLCAFFLTIGHMPILGLLTLPEDPLYRTYELAPRILQNFDAKDDQVMGAVIMELIAVGVSLGMLGFSLWGWMREDEAKAVRDDAKRARPPA